MPCCEVCTDLWGCGHKEQCTSLLATGLSHTSPVISAPPQHFLTVGLLFTLHPHANSDIQPLWLSLQLRCHPTSLDRVYLPELARADSLFIHFHWHRMVALDGQHRVDHVEIREALHKYAVTSLQKQICHHLSHTGRTVKIQHKSQKAFQNKQRQSLAGTGMSSNFWYCVCV